jgi:hypothetical protein
VKDKGYTGSIKNQGSQIVKAPHQTKTTPPTKVVRGADLRTSKST